MKPVNRWMLPGTVAVVIVASATVPHAFASTPDPNLPTVSAADLIAGVRTASVETLSGTLQLDSALGLPDLPNELTGAQAGGAALLLGTHTLKLWADGPDRQRLAVLGSMSETDLVHNGTDLWSYDSATNAATHRVVPQSGASGAGEQHSTDVTPQAAAQQLLANLDPSTAVAVAGTDRVAGRSAYRLTLTPRTTDTLIRSVAVDIDAANHIPLRVQVFGTGASPSWSLGFSDVSFTTPAASEFRFTPPASATVTQGTGHSAAGAGPAAASPGDTAPSATNSSAQPRTIGTGWATVLEFPAADLNLGSTAGGEPGSHHNSTLGWLDSAATAVPEGRLLTTNLISLLITPDGRAFVGAVPGSALRAAAAK